MSELSSQNEDVNYRNENVIVTRPNWGAIWAGMFTVIAIWSVFGMLGAAIFSSAANPNVLSPDIKVGMAIWGVILTIIAMFVGGRVTGQFAGPANSRWTHAMVMFGLSVTAALMLVIGGNFLGNIQVTEATHNAFLLGVFSELGWPLFVALFLGCLAAVGGATTAHREIAYRALQQQASHAS